MTNHFQFFEFLEIKKATIKIGDISITTLFFGAVIGSEKAKNGKARLAKPFLNVSNFLLPCIICNCWGKEQFVVNYMYPHR